MSAKGFQHFIGQLLLSVLIPVLVILAFYLGIGNVYTGSVSHAENVLKNALEENITECYAEEGRYPESLSYLEKIMVFAMTMTCFTLTTRCVEKIFAQKSQY